MILVELWVIIKIVFVGDTEIWCLETMNQFIQIQHHDIPQYISQRRIIMEFLDIPFKTIEK